MLMIDSANFRASDMSDKAKRCWFHNGKFPRILLANEPFEA
jgi:hypothetical protein